MKRILITGANGFVAKYLKDLFKKDEVFLTDISGANVMKCDITSPEQVRDLIKKTKPDEIYHLAAIASPRAEDAGLVSNVNVGGTLNILKAVKKIKPEAKILLVSSGYVYGNCKKPAKETDLANPEGIYAQSKLDMEREALASFADLNIYIARAFTHSGKNQSLGFFFPDMAQKIANAKKIKKPQIEVYNPQTKRDFTHVKDVVAGYKLILEKGSVGEIYNVCSGKSYNILEVFEEMAKQAKLKDYSVKKVKHGVVLDLLGDNSKITKIGFRTQHSINEIIEEFTAQ